MELVILTAVFIASLLGTLTGFGLATILMPIMAIFFPFPQALLMVGIVHFFGDLWRMALFRRGAQWRLVLLFGLPGLLASFLTARLVFEIPELYLEKLMGLLLIGIASWSLLHPKWRVSKSDPILIGGGLATGILSGLTGIGGAIRAAFLNTYRLKQAAYLFTTGVIGFMVDTARLAGYWQAEVSLPISLPLLLVAIALSLAGTVVAKKVVRHLPAKLFSQMVNIFLLLAGINYLFF
jgi:uncharacterized membrane protein YfcA